MGDLPRYQCAALGGSLGHRAGRVVAVRRGEPVNSSQQGGLARAVRSDNPQRLPAGNLHVHAAQCPRFAPGVFLGPHGPVQHLQQRVVAAGADA